MIHVPSTITALPHDVWGEIASNLTKADLVTLSRVSRDCKRLCDSDGRWKSFVEKRHLPRPPHADPHTGAWKGRAFSYCRHHNDLFRRVLNSATAQQSLGPFQIPTEVQENLFAAKQYIAEHVHQSPMACRSPGAWVIRPLWRATEELRSRLVNCVQCGDPLSVEDIQVLLEEGARFDHGMLPLLSAFCTLTWASGDNIDVVERLHALLDQVGHPGSNRFGISALECARVLCRWGGRFADMSERTVAQIIEASKNGFHYRGTQSFDHFPWIPVDFPRYREFFVSVCRYYPKVIHYVSQNIEDYIPLVLDAIEGNASLFLELSAALRSSPDFLRRAVLRNNRILPLYASTRKDISDPTLYRELAMLALQQKGTVAGKIVWDATPDYQEFVTDAIDMMIKQGRHDDMQEMLRAIDPARVDYQALVEKAVLEDPESILAVRVEFVNNWRTLFKSAVARDPTLIRVLGECADTDIEEDVEQVALLAREDFGLEEYRTYAMEAVRLNGCMLYYLDQRRLGPEYYREIVIAALRHDGYALFNVGEEFQKDPEIVAVAIKQNPRAIDAAWDGFKTDFTPLLRTCAHYKEAEQLFLARWHLGLDRKQTDDGFALIAKMAAKSVGCPKHEVERLLGRIQDSSRRSAVRSSLDSLKVGKQLARALKKVDCTVVRLLLERGSRIV